MSMKKRTKQRIGDSVHINKGSTTFAVLHWSYEPNIPDKHNKKKTHSQLYHTSELNIQRFHKPISKCFNLNHGTPLDTQ